jgi:alpha-glucosidase
VTLTSPAASPATPWWRTAVIYQIYPRSFADASGDGIGDLPGITSRLPHLAALGVDAIWLSPFYCSPQHDAGYDVSDYRDIDPLFGSLADADAMIAQAHGLGIRVIVDLVPNHTSSAHPWFIAALASPPGSMPRARYIFRDGRGPDGSQPPNDWTSVFGGPAWTRLPDGQWYLHLFDSSQPDLDWTNPEVPAEFDDILRFWLRRGVDGFRIDVAHGIIKADGLPDRTVPPDSGADPNFYRGPMWDQDGVHDVFRRWRRVLDEVDGGIANPDSRALVAEAWVEPLARLARYVRPDEMQQAFNFTFLTSPWSASEFRERIAESLAVGDSVGATTTWVLSNHDVVRHPSRYGLANPGARPNGIFAHDPQPDEALGLRRGRAATLLMLALPGSAYIYQGEELGLPEHTSLPDEVRQDPTFRRTGGAQAGRDGCRVPIPWEAGKPAFGFSPTGASWLPQPAGWATYAADAQAGVAGSTLELYRSAIARRRELGLGAGGLDWLDEYPDGVVAFRNSAPGRPDVVVLANVGAEPVALPAGAAVLMASGLVDADMLPPNTTVWLTA